jgi:ferredoxin-NADP reductase
MLYSNKTGADIVFRDELESMQQADRNIEIKHVLTREPEWKGLKGHIDAGMVREQIPDYMDRVFYICGPPKMNDALSQALKDLRMPEEKIKVEHFTGYE